MCSEKRFHRLRRVGLRQKVGGKSFRRVRTLQTFFNFLNIFRHFFFFFAFFAFSLSKHQKHHRVQRSTYNTFPISEMYTYHKDTVRSAKTMKAVSVNRSTHVRFYFTQLNRPFLRRSNRVCVRRNVITLLVHVVTHQDTMNITNHKTRSKIRSIMLKPSRMV